MLTITPDRSFLRAPVIRQKRYTPTLKKAYATDLIEASKKAGIRGVVIAGELGVAQSTVNRWLHRETPVPPKHIRRFAELLKITTDQVLPQPKADNGKETD
jgi:transcriptional regulator with XRE-family HTH domain